MRRKFLDDFDKVDYYTDRTGDCWLWTGVINRNGYGQVNTRGPEGWTTTSAHRFTYITYKGIFPKELHIDHLCRNRACVNPEHLEPVTRLENVARSSIGEKNRSKLRCIRGHDFSPDNTRERHGHRQCKKCLYQNVIKHRARRALIIN